MVGTATERIAALTRVRNELRRAELAYAEDLAAAAVDVIAGAAPAFSGSAARAKLEDLREFEREILRQDLLEARALASFAESSGTQAELLSCRLRRDRAEKAAAAVGVS